MTTISADLLVRKDSTNEMYNKIVKPQWDVIRLKLNPTTHGITEVRRHGVTEVRRK